MIQKGRLIYDTTNNDFVMHVHGNASPSLTLTNSTLTMNGITCSAILFIGSGAKTTPTLVGVYIGMDSVAAGGIEICANSTQHIDFTLINSDYKRKDVLYE